MQTSDWLVCAVVVCCAASASCGESHSPLLDADAVVDGLAKAETRNAVTEDLRLQRKRLVDRLIVVVANSAKDASERIAAATILGDLRAPEAVGVLLKNIDLRPKSAEATGLWDSLPCAKALVRIGKPTSEAILKEIGETRVDNAETAVSVMVRIDLLTKLLVSIEGAKVARFSIETLLKELPDSKRGAAKLALDSMGKVVTPNE